MPLSIRHRLLLFLMGGTLLAWVATATMSYKESLNEIEEVFDAQLVQSAKALLLLSQHELYEQLAFDAASPDEATRSIQDDLLDTGHDYEQIVAFQLWINGNKLAARSASAPDVPMTDAINTFSDRTINDATWRVYAIADPQKPLTVHVGERLDARHELAVAISARGLTAVGLALPVLAALIWFGVGRALRPLQNIAKETALRGVDRLDHIDIKQVPQEALPLVDALNKLFSRVQASVENERRFTADAAHELRTPLAAIKTQAQVALYSVQAPEHQQALRQVVAGVDRATHLVEQLLTLARLDPESPRTKQLTMAQTDMCSLIQGVVADLSPHAVANSIDLGVGEQCVGHVRGNADLIGILVRNLVINSIRYTPEGGTVDVTVAEIANGVKLSVSDSGPGIPPEDREKVFQRFFRRLTTNGVTGSGLGLSIVQRIAEIHGATIKLGDSPLGGLQVDVLFGKES